MKVKITDVKAPVVVPRGYRQLWREKYQFNRNVLRLNAKKAKAAAHRTVVAFR